jgi:hypothetical protein
MTTTRHGNKWTTTEILTLQREYELLELSIPEIAIRHKRSITSILCKLECEGFTENCNDETPNSFHIYIPGEAEGCAAIDLCAEECSDCDDDVASEVDKLTERVWNLETSVTDIKGMVKSMFDTLVQKKQQPKRASLRKSSR